MALWQFSFFVLPKLLFEYNLSIEESDGFRTINDDEYWRLANIPCSNFEDIESFLPKGDSWSENLLVFGNIDSNCLKLNCESQIVLSATLRIDFTTKYASILRELIEYFISHGLSLLDEDLNIVQLNFENIKQTIESSPQVKTYRKMNRDYEV